MGEDTNMTPELARLGEGLHDRWMKGHFWRLPDCQGYGPGLTLAQFALEDQREGVARMKNRGEESVGEVGKLMGFPNVLGKSVLSKEK